MCFYLFIWCFRFVCHEYLKFGNLVISILESLHDFESLSSVWWIVLMSLTLIVSLSKCEQVCFALFFYHVFDILRLVMWIGYWLRWKAMEKNYFAFCYLKLKLIFFFFFNIGFGPIKKLVEFVVKLCFIWSFMLNVWGMNYFEKKKKLMYQANEGFWPSWEFEFYFAFCFDDKWHDKCIMKRVFSFIHLVFWVCLSWTFKFV